MNRSEWLLVLGITVLSFLMMALVSQEPIEAAKAAVEATRLASGGLAQAPTAAPTPLQTVLPTPPPPTITPRPTMRPTATPTTVPTPSATPFPFDTHPELDRYIYIDQLSQHMYIFQHGELYRTIPCSTGLPTNTTYTEAWEGKVGYYYGTFQSFGVYADRARLLFICAAIELNALRMTSTVTGSGITAAFR